MFGVGLRKALAILTAVALSCSLLPAVASTAFADFSASSTKVLGVGRIQSETKVTTLEPQQKLEKFETKVDSQKSSQLAKPIDRDVVDIKTEAEAAKTVADPITKPASENSKPGTSAKPKIEWNTGSATAYGPTSSAIWRTADGSDLTNTTVGVAVPIEWKSKLFGKTLEIEDKGIQIRAKVTDVGHFLKNGRSLDLQPGVFKAFGFNTASAWGVHTVRWRVVN
jgi:hypothetical protein